MPTPISADSFEHAATSRDADSADRNYNENNQNQRACPGLAMPLIKWRDGVSENLQRQRGCWLVHLPVPVLIAESRKKQRGSLAGHASEGQHDSGDHARSGGAESDGRGGAATGEGQAQSN